MHLAQVQVLADNNQCCHDFEKTIVAARGESYAILRHSRKMDNDVVSY